MAIDNIQNREVASSVRDKLNQTIGICNDLDDRVEVLEGLTGEVAAHNAATDVHRAYVKQNVLPDDVCDALGIPTTSEPKDALTTLLEEAKKGLIKSDDGELKPYEPALFYVKNSKMSSAYGERGGGVSPDGKKIVTTSSTVISLFNTESASVNPVATKTFTGNGFCHVQNEAVYDIDLENSKLQIFPITQTTIGAPTVITITAGSTWRQATVSPIFMSDNPDYFMFAGRRGTVIVVWRYDKKNKVVSEVKTISMSPSPPYGYNMSLASVFTGDGILVCVQSDNNSSVCTTSLYKVALDGTQTLIWTLPNVQRQGSPSVLLTYDPTKNEAYLYEAATNTVPKIRRFNVAPNGLISTFSLTAPLVGLFNTKKGLYKEYRGGVFTRISHITGNAISTSHAHPSDIYFTNNTVTYTEAAIQILPERFGQVFPVISDSLIRGVATGKLVSIGGALE